MIKLNGGNFYITVISYLLVVFLIIGGFVFFRKYLLKRLGGVKNGTHMKIIDRLIISQDKQIVLIEMRNRMLVVGITQQRMETLADFDKPEKSDKSEKDEDCENSGNEGTDLFNNKNNGFFDLLNEKIKTGFNKSNDRNKNEKDKK